MRNSRLSISIGLTRTMVKKLLRGDRWTFTVTKQVYMPHETVFVKHSDGSSTGHTIGGKYVNVDVEVSFKKIKSKEGKGRRT